MKIILIKNNYSYREKKLENRWVYSKNTQKYKNKTGKNGNIHLLMNCI